MENDEREWEPDTKEQTQTDTTNWYDTAKKNNERLLQETCVRPSPTLLPPADADTVAACPSHLADAAGTPTMVLFLGENGLTNSFYILSNGLQIACAAGHNVVVEFTRDLLSDSRVDISEAVNVPVLNQKLLADCNNTQVIHRQCLSKLQQKAAVDAKAKKSASVLYFENELSSSSSSSALYPTYQACPFQDCAPKVKFEPPVMRWLMAIVPNHHRIVWLPLDSNKADCRLFDHRNGKGSDGKGHNHSDKNKNHIEYNAVHFNLDVDWILYRCEGVHKWHDWKRFAKDKLCYKDSAGAVVSARHQIEQACCSSSTGEFAPFIRAAVKKYVREMGLQFRIPNLPLVVASSLGKVSPATVWVLDEFKQLVRSELRVPLNKIWLGSSGTSYREINAAADLGMLLNAKDVVLTNRSTFSYLVQAHFEARGRGVGFVDPGDCGLGRPSWVWV